MFSLYRLRDPGEDLFAYGGSVKDPAVVGVVSKRSLNAGHGAVNVALLHGVDFNRHGFTYIPKLTLLRSATAQGIDGELHGTTLFGKDCLIIFAQRLDDIGRKRGLLSALRLLNLNHRWETHE